MPVHTSLSGQRRASECFKQRKDLTHLYFKKLTLVLWRVTGDKTAGKAYLLGGYCNKPCERLGKDARSEAVTVEIVSLQLFKVRDSGAV